MTMHQAPGQTKYFIDNFYSDGFLPSLIFKKRYDLVSRQYFLDKGLSCHGVIPCTRDWDKKQYGASWNEFREASHWLSSQLQNPELQQSIRENQKLFMQGMQSKTPVRFGDFFTWYLEHNKISKEEYCSLLGRELKLCVNSCKKFLMKNGFTGPDGCAQAVYQVFSRKICTHFQFVQDLPALLAPLLESAGLQLEEMGKLQNITSREGDNVSGESWCIFLSLQDRHRQKHHLLEICFSTAADNCYAQSSMSAISHGSTLDVHGVPSNPIPRSQSGIHSNKISSAQQSGIHPWESTFRIVLDEVNFSLDTFVGFFHELGHVLDYISQNLSHPGKYNHELSEFPSSLLEFFVPVAYLQKQAALPRVEDYLEFHHHALNYTGLFGVGSYLAAHPELNQHTPGVSMDIISYRHQFPSIGQDPLLLLDVFPPNANRAYYFAYILPRILARSAYQKIPHEKILSLPCMRELCSLSIPDLAQEIGFPLFSSPGSRP